MTEGKRAGGTGDGRMWDGKRAESRRRKRRSAPGVIGLCLVMVLASVLVVTTPPARAAPIPAATPEVFVSHSGGNPTNVTNESVCLVDTIWFNETGLPSGDKWAVTLSGDKVSSSAASIKFTEPCNKVYPFTVTPPTGYYAFPASGNVGGSGTTYVTIQSSPCDPTDVPVDISSIVVTPEATDASLTWDESPAGSSTSFYWGLTPGYLYGSQSVPGSGSYSLSLNFLEPSATYYYKIVAEPPAGTCTITYTQGTSSGSWGTQSDPVSPSTVIQGAVSGKTSSGTTPAGANLFVEAQGCFSYGGVEYEFNNVGVTSSAGQYSIPLLQGAVVDSGCSVPMTVSVYNQVNLYDAGQKQSVVWPGYWNETILIWAPQTVNFVLPMNYNSGYLPAIVDFSNSPYTSLSVAQSTGYEQSYTYDWVASGTVGGDVNFGGGTSSSTTETNGYSIQNTEGVNSYAFCWASEYQVTGSIGFSATTRGWSYALTVFDPTNGNFCSNVGVKTPTNWVPNGTSPNSYFLDDAGTQWSNGLQNVGLQGTQFLSWHFDVSSTTSVSTTYSLTFGVSGSLAGVLPLSFQSSASWTQSVSVTTTTELSYTLNGPGAGGGVACYNVVGEGGSASQETADMVALFYWQGSLVNGEPVCT
jgi:hypothetical protein